MQKGPERDKLQLAARLEFELFQVQVEACE